jgi:hypothetical protein
MYLFALSLRRNPRLASSGEPMSFWEEKELSNIDTQIRAVCFNKGKRHKMVYNNKSKG